MLERNKEGSLLGVAASGKGIILYDLTRPAPMVSAWALQRRLLCGACCDYCHFLHVSHPPALLAVRNDDVAAFTLTKLVRFGHSRLIARTVMILL